MNNGQNNHNGLIAHRLSKIINKNGINYYIARGNSNAYPDNPVKINNIAGRIVGAETTGLGGRIIRVIKST